MNDNDDEAKARYYNLSEAARSIVEAEGVKQKSIASVKLIGKTFFNAALFSGREIKNITAELFELKEIYSEYTDEKLKKLYEHGTAVEKMAALAILQERYPEKFIKKPTS